ncbi:hypothetical protein [Vagococcus salmoninarum]|uniref:hypothetical protein n=1 Tax=Vagococcus salmoninarum TaxID=2739 RepID=UPI0028D76727|nr:hypothetical protein [Vagococcus salmoninarum]
MKSKQLVYLMILMGISVIFGACGIKKEQSINDAWKVIDAVPEDRKNIGNMLGEDNGTIYF